MGHGQSVLVACSIQRGAFSGERVFHLVLASGEEYSGVAPVGYCYDDSRNHLGRDEPSGNTKISGFVEAMLIANGGDEATVELPDGEAHRVRLSQVPFRRSDKREAEYVPL